MKTTKEDLFPLDVERPWVVFYPWSCHVNQKVINIQNGIWERHIYSTDQRQWYRMVLVRNKAISVMLMTGILSTLTVPSVRSGQKSILISIYNTQYSSMWMWWHVKVVLSLYRVRLHSTLQFYSIFQFYIIYIETTKTINHVSLLNC